VTQPTRDDVLTAREVIAGRVHRTPTFRSATLGERIGAQAFLKAELFQKTGSFKPRGMLAKIASLGADEAARGIVTWSAGNAAQAAAFAAAQSGIDCRVFMWRTANLALVRGTGRVFVHPFDDPVLQAGHGSLGLEVVEDVPDVDTIVVPVGGGGLIAGVATAADCRVVGVEPEAAPTLTTALAAGRPEAIRPSSIADGLNAPFTGEGTLAVCRERVDEIVLVSDGEIAAGMRFLYSRAKLACEPAGAAATAALLAGKVTVEPGSTVVAVVSGGNADPKVASAILGEADES